MKSRSYVKSLVDSIPGASYTSFKIYKDAADNYAIAKARGHVRVMSWILVLFLWLLCSLELVLSLLTDCHIYFKCVCPYSFTFSFVKTLTENLRTELSNSTSNIGYKAYLISRPMSKALHHAWACVHSENRTIQSLYKRYMSRMSWWITRGKEG